jgi:cytochrome c peroxidase
MHVISIRKELPALARTIGAAALVLAAVVAASAASPAQVSLLDRYVAAAKADPGYTAPSAERGRAFFFAAHAGGKADTPACTACHSGDLTGPGRTKAGKVIEPMAASVVPTRYSDPATVEKWFRRNCQDVLGRACSAAEKADVLAFLLSL